MSSTWITGSAPPGDGSRPWGRETEMGSCALMAAWLLSALSAGAAHARSVTRRAALSHAGDQFVARLDVAVQRLHHLSESVVGNPGLDPDRLQRFVSLLLPYHLRLVTLPLALATGCRR